jgi:hypothetical protein
LRSIGERDIRIQLLNAAGNALAPVYKAHKWLRTRGDLEYTALWILYAATPLAKVGVLSGSLLADREVIPQAVKFEPRLLQGHLHRTHEHEEDSQERAGSNHRHRRLSGGKRRKTVRPVAAPPKSRTTSSATSASVA